MNRRMRLFGSDWDPRIVLHDLRRPLPWPPGSVEAVYTSHTVEHLSREQGQHLFAECRRVLKPGGVLRVVVPDLKHVVEDYVSGRLPADHFVATLGVLYSEQGGMLRRKLAPFVEFPHRCMYDAPALMRAFQAAGFAAEPRAPFDSAIQDIHAIEVADRTMNAVIVEGQARS
jgi:SAM-dependent methyltransferase